jgi:hypothetical protein
VFEAEGFDAFWRGTDKYKTRIGNSSGKICIFGQKSISRYYCIRLVLLGNPDDLVSARWSEEGCV